MVWKEAKDPSTGKPYYYNEAGETRWERPAEMDSVPAPVAAPPPIGGGRGEWREVTDQSSGKPYYYNTITKETSWTKPAGLSEPAPQGPPPGPATSEGEAVPEPQTGKPYYYNTRTLETRWDPPEGMAGNSGGNAAPVWKSAQDPTGRTYWYNTQTKETTWEKPPGADGPDRGAGPFGGGMPPFGMGGGPGYMDPYGPPGGMGGFGGPPMGGGGYGGFGGKGGHDMGGVDSHMATTIFGKLELTAPSSLLLEWVGMTMGVQWEEDLEEGTEGRLEGMMEGTEGHLEGMMEGTEGHLEGMMEGTEGHLEDMEEGMVVSLEVVSLALGFVIAPLELLARTGGPRTITCSRPRSVSLSSAKASAHSVTGAGLRTAITS
eukprot:TRINITY_DN8100_c0_g1_i8.p1 TRINITY_DN8100_c0_g1~~TRINITY_DN8100_c0_g1_i8.p1  ORF type:complete len:375 (+),score=45.15 TRINITY_DN8100_c0_g1_i8:60-1184(+)